MKTLFKGSLSKQMAKLKDALNFITENGVKMGLSADEISSATTMLQNMLNDIDKLTADNMVAEQSAATQKNNSAAAVPQFSLIINRMKCSPNWTPDNNKKFRSDSKKNVPDPINYKPKFKVKIVAGIPQVHFTKKGVDGMNIMVKAGDETVFTLDQVALRGPAILKRQFKAGVTQLVSVQLQAFKNGKPIGQPSDVATFAFGG